MSRIEHVTVVSEGQVKELIFATGNTHKYSEAKAILASMEIDLRLRICRLDELQTTDETKLIRRKCLDAY